LAPGSFAAQQQPTKRQKHRAARRAWKIQILQSISFHFFLKVLNPKKKEYKSTLEEERRGE